MRQVWTLTRMQLGSAFDFLNMKRSKNLKKNISVTTILVLGFLLFAFLSGTYSFIMAIALKSMDLLDVLPGLFMAVTCLMILVTSIYKVKGVLFGFKDYDIVMSLPMKSWVVVASRLMLLYLINMVFVLAILVPNYIIYGVMAKASPVFYVLSMVSLLFIPIIPIIIASILGVILAVISAGFKHSNAIHTILMFAATLLVILLSFQMQSENQIAEFGTLIRDKMVVVYPLAGWYLKGIIQSDILSYTAFLVVSILALIVFSIIVGRYFKWMNTVISARRTTSKYKVKELKTSGQLKALYLKEAKRYFSCTIYLLNTSIGLVLMLVGVIALVFLKSDQIEQILNIPEAAGMLKEMVPYLMSFMVSLVAITASSISLEGKNIWILKSAPVPAKTILAAKISLSLSMTIPASILTSLLAGIGLKMGVLDFLLTLALPISYCYLTAVLGLVINLKLPMLEWKNETVVVKQSAASMMGSLGGFLTVGIPIALLFMVNGINVMALGYGTVVVVLLISGILQVYLNKNGAKLIARL
ncbi:putative ABC transporter permease subunit [Lachnoclostridium phytofermentans]|uniref:Uncharacterized protein n=1 Tax=Lachnoclostridium phytofermentans (strain ATCC 700394 / DSM 18823 / ISDg) TaxID=357809 RepID=A9KQ52_LACP7|nr:hypothetical protein [Lachnoclostridium phytofermentans]ABX43364.1 conserved hypothetical protein [Lachnoclostridium phytofermentans ISDg]